MKASDLMLGNFVANCDDHKCDTVIAISDGMVHLGESKLSDDERDIEGVPLAFWINEQTCGKLKSIIYTSIKGIHLSFFIKYSIRKTILVFSLNGSSPDIIITHLHQLQNFIFILTGQHFNIDHKWQTLD